ncbi:MAG: hypothetical protein IAG10_24495 [Planctomycetaceae bacterium]|nr:hypothetical protein [Planctomycetaceae bacterium]
MSLQFLLLVGVFSSVLVDVLAALELMQHRLPEVRGRAILDGVRHAEAPWARAALEQGAPHALRYTAAFKTERSD